MARSGSGLQDLVRAMFPEIVANPHASSCEDDQDSGISPVDLGQFLGVARDDLFRPSQLRTLELVDAEVDMLDLNVLSDRSRPRRSCRTIFRWLCHRPCSCHQRSMRSPQCRPSVWRQSPLPLHHRSQREPARVASHYQWKLTFLTIGKRAR